MWTRRLLLGLSLAGCAGPEDTGKATSSGETADTAAPADTAGPDADGDGVPDADDCAPDDPYTYPGAEEWCDPVDHDCDGEPLPDGVCGKVQLAEALRGAVYLYDDDPEARVVVSGNLGDLDGEPGDELALAGTFGPVAFLSGDFPTEDTNLWAAADWEVSGAYGALPVGDFDGDGANDLAIVTTGYDSYGSALVLPGPISEWPASTSTRDLEAYGWAQLRPPVYDEEMELGDGFGDDSSAGDANGDGLGDLAVAAPSSEEATTFVLFGRVGGGSPELDLRAEAGNTGSGARANFLGDVDGDGLDDLDIGIVTLGLLSGTDVTPGAWEDWWALTRSFPGDGDGAACERVSSDGPLGIGDWDADGYDDVAVQCGGTGWTVLHFLSGADLTWGEAGTSVTSLAAGSWDLSAHERMLLRDNAADVDDDGVADLQLYVMTELDYDTDRVSSYTTFVPSSDGAPDPMSDPLARGWGLRSERFAPEGTTASGAAGDFDGDGDVDFALGVKAAPGDGAEVLLLPGWGLPWDEARLF